MSWRCCSSFPMASRERKMLVRMEGEGEFNNESFGGRWRGQESLYNHYFFSFKSCPQKKSAILPLLLEGSMQEEKKISVQPLYFLNFLCFVSTFYRLDVAQNPISQLLNFHLSFFRGGAVTTIPMYIIFLFAVRKKISELLK